jgi:hypothetical protein
MNKRQNWFGHLITLVAAVLILQNAAMCEDEGDDFLATVKENFPTWDLNHDGSLSGKEILRAFENPNTKGRAAAAIVVLEGVEKAHKGHGEPLESLTLEQISHLNERLDKHGRRKNPEKAFQSSVRKIDAALPQLFAHGLPQIDKLVQGDANDCYFMSVVGALINERPSDLAKLIEANTDGSYTVHFFQQPPVTISCPTPAEISAFNTDTSDGLWYPVLLKAYGKFKQDNHWRIPDAPQDQVNPLEAAVIKGGRCPQVVALLTGHATKVFETKKIEQAVRGKLSRAFAEHRLVMVGVPGHVMTAIAYDKNSDQIQIWNPWGTNSVYKVLGAKMTHGMMWIPISQFTEKCQHVSFEQLTEAAPGVSVGRKGNGGGNHKHRQRG